MQKHARYIFLCIFLVCAGLLGFALYLQEVKHLLPCPLCVVQRIAYWLSGIIALLAFLHFPAATGRRIYSSLLAISALAGAIVALRHAWLLRFPNSFECGISLEERFLNALPVARWWPGMFEANGDCSRISWQFLTLTIPDWSFICFASIFALAVYMYKTSNHR